MGPGSPHILLQLAATLTCSFAPGLAILTLALPRVYRRLEWDRRLALAHAISLATTLVLGTLVYVVPPGVFRALAWGFVIAALGLATLGALRFQRRIDVGAAALMVVLIATSLYVLSLTPVAGIITAGYGDIPAYARIADNLLKGRHEPIDFLAEDLPGLRYVVPLYFPGLTHPYLVVLAVLPRAHLALQLAGALSGALLVLVGGGILLRAAGAQRPSPLAWIVAGGAAAVPLEVVLHTCLGGTSLQSAVQFLILLDLLWRKPIRAGIVAKPLVGMCLANVIASRPEGAFLGAVFLACLTIAILVDQMRRSQTRPHVRWAALAALLALTACSVSVAPTVISHWGFSGAYLHYDSTHNEFRFADYGTRSTGNPVGFLTRGFVLNVAGVAQTGVAVNHDIAAEIRQHPVEMARWLHAQATYNYGTRLVSVGFLLLLVLLWTRRAMPVVLAAVVAVALGLLLFVNAGATSRHAIPILVPAFILATSEVLTRAQRVLASRAKILAPLLAIVCTVFGVVSAIKAYRVVRFEATRHWVEMLGAVREHIRPGDSVLTVYPQLISLYFDVSARGNSRLDLTLDTVVRRDQPDLVVLDACRYDIGDGNYASAHRSWVERGSAPPEYRLVHDDLARRITIFRREEQHPRPADRR